MGLIINEVNAVKIKEAFQSLKDLGRRFSQIFIRVNPIISAFFCVLFSRGGACVPGGYEFRD